MDDRQQWRSRVRHGLLGVVATAGVLGLAVTVVGASNGADDPPTSSRSADDDGTPDQGPGDVGSTVPPPTTAVPAGATRTIPVAGVGVVVITESPLGLVSATPVAGVSVGSEVSTREVHVRFTDASGG